MPCPVCTNTLQCIHHANNRRAYHCPRCGTLRIETGPPEATRADDYKPVLIDRLLSLWAALAEASDVTTLRKMSSLGIFECIAGPENRPDLS